MPKQSMRQMDWAAMHPLPPPVEKLKERQDFTITRLTPEERDALRAASDMGPMWQELCGKWLEKRYPGKDMVKVIPAELEKIHKEVLAKGAKK